jgi:tape measure domain-containing protein
MPRNIVGEIFLNVLPQDGGVNAGVQKIIQQANTTAGAKVPVAADTRQAEESVARLTGSVQDGLGGAFAQAAIQAAGFTAAILGTKAAVEGVIGKFSGLFDQLAQAQAGFSAILGSKQAGGALLDEIREFARVSPFVTQELVNYSQQLLGVGQSAESIVPLLKNTGDLIASVGGDTQNISRVLFTLTQIRSIGRLVGQDAIQLQSSLVPITKLLADFLGKTTQEIKKMQEQGSISADTVFAAINNAGSKVEGAMNNATRNIAGARAVLSDTVTILFQNSEALQEIFEDIFKGILSFSEALSDEDFLSTFNRVTEGIGGIYDALKPVFEGFSGAAATGAVSGLKIFASTLEALGGALNAIPEAGLKAIGVFFAALAALKAPLFLIQYVSSIRTLGTVISPQGLGRSVTSLTTNLKTQEVQMEQTALAAQKLGTRYEQMGLKAKTAATAAASAALIGGTVLSGSDSEGAKLLGGALTGAALGASVTGFNPAGIIAGAGIGFVTSFLTAANDEVEDKKEELAQIGDTMARRILSGFILSEPLGLSTQRGVDILFGSTGDIADVEQEIVALTGEAEKLHDTLALLLPPSGGDNSYATYYEGVAKQVEATDRKLAELKATQTALFEQPGIVEFLDSAAAKLAALNKIKPIDPALFDPTGGRRPGTDAITIASKQLAFVTGQAIPKTTAEIALWEEGLGKLGLTAADTGKTVEVLTIMLDTTLPSALRNTRTEMEATRLKMDEAGKAATEFFAPFKLELDTIKTATEQTKKLNDAFDAVAAQGSGAAEAQALTAELFASATSIFKLTQAAPGGDAIKAAAASTEFFTSAFVELRGILGGTEADFEDFLRTAGLWRQYQATAGTQAGFIGTLKELSTQTGVNEEELQHLLGLANDFDKTITLIVDADVTDAIAKLEQLQLILARGALPGGGPLSTGERERLEAQIAELEKTIDILKGGVRGVGGEVAGRTPAELAKLAQDQKDLFRQQREASLVIPRQQRELALQAERDAEAARKEAERLAEEAAREAEQRAREAEALAKTIESAGDTITNAIQSAADAIKSAADGWEASIRERTQFERALSAERLITNTGRQVADITELGTGIQSLLNRGLSQDAIDAIGIDNVADLRQVRKLLLSDPADLAQLSSLVAQRDDASEKIAERAAQEQTKNTMVTAIVEAARILGFEVSDATAVSIAAQFNVNQDTDAAQFGQQILDFLMASGQIART